MANTYSGLRNEYGALWLSMILRPEKRPEIDHFAARLSKPAVRQRYEAVSHAVGGIPWYVVGILHGMEASFNFGGHLHNGDPLTARTVQVPKGRPKVGAPPFAWEASAIDALQFEKLDGVPSWPLERIAYVMEGYNGWGYRNHHPSVLSPYLWSFTNHYTRGKYVADGTWSDTAVSGQVGAMAILRSLIDSDVIAMPERDTPDTVAPEPAVPAFRVPFPGRNLVRGLHDDVEVKRLQARLSEQGAAIVADGDFGGMTEAAVKLYQARNIGHDGKPLAIDGIVGPDTWNMIFNRGLSQAPSDGSGLLRDPETPFRAALLAVASDEVGAVEDPAGTNRGPLVDEYIRSVGLDPADDSYPWCVCFLYWCAVKAAQRSGQSLIMPRTAAVHTLWRQANASAAPNIRVVTTAQSQADSSLVRPGMVFMIDTGGSTGHAGLVVANANGQLETIEGNTNLDGSREGYGVFRRSGRRVSSISLGFAAFG